MMNGHGINGIEKGFLSEYSCSIYSNAHDKALGCCFCFGKGVSVS